MEGFGSFCEFWAKREKEILFGSGDWTEKMHEKEKGGQANPLYKSGHENFLAV